MNIKRGIIKACSRVLIYGVQGVGKSTLASQIPDAIFFDTEGGTRQLDVARQEVSSWGDVRAGFSELIKAEKPEFRNVIVDTISVGEALMCKEMLKQEGKKSIHDYPYGKGYGRLVERFSKFLDGCDTLVTKGCNVVLIGHASLERLHDPEIGDTDHWAPDLDKRIVPLISRRVDAMLFLKYKTTAVQFEGDSKKRAVGGTERVLGCSHTAAYDAKCRFDLTGEVPATYEAIKPIFA